MSKKNSQSSSNPVANLQNVIGHIGHNSLQQHHQFSTQMPLPQWAYSPFAVAMALERWLTIENNGGYKNNAHDAALFAEITAIRAKNKGGIA